VERQEDGVAADVRCHVGHGANPPSTVTDFDVGIWRDAE
jgi:hypothetical protein